MYRRRLRTHDTECISEPDAEDTAHRLDDDPASQAQTQRGRRRRSGSVGGIRI